jgi:WD40 repeat protein
MGKQAILLQGHKKQVSSVAINADGKYVISGDLGGTICIWEVGTAKLLQEFKAHTNSVETVAISSDASFFVSGSEDKTTYIWSAFDNEQIRSLHGYQLNFITRVYESAQAGRRLNLRPGITDKFIRSRPQKKLDDRKVFATLPQCMQSSLREFIALP